MTHPQDKPARYQVGPYWLSQRRPGGNWYITWFDAAARQTRRQSTGTRDSEDAKTALERHYCLWPSAHPREAGAMDRRARARAASIARATQAAPAPLPVGVALEPGEVMRAIPGYPAYFATSHGRIIGSGGRTLPTFPRQPGGYPTVNVKRVPSVRVSVPCTRNVHRLVLEAFVGPRPIGAEACHRNDNPWDNRLSNLRWATPDDNRADAERNRNVRAQARAAASALTA